MRRALLLCILSGLAACGDGSSTNPTVVDPDPDGDGILSDLDSCPNQAETVNNIIDWDGCPDSAVEFYALVREDVEAYWDSVFAKERRESLGT